MARKKKPEEHENHERWLVSYADFITLLFAFFVVLYSISSVNEGKFRVLSDALIAAFRSAPKSMMPIQVGEPLVGIKDMNQDVRDRPDAIEAIRMPLRKEAQRKSAVVDTANDTEGDKNRSIKIMADEIGAILSGLIKSDVVNIESGSEWLEIEIKTKLLFAPGSAFLEEASIPILEAVAKVIRRFANTVRIEGYTDNTPIRTVYYPSNWELSATRAASVVHLFANMGVDPARLSAEGFSEYRPIADNSTPQGREANRRIVILVRSLKLDKSRAKVKGVEHNEVRFKPVTDIDLDRDLSGELGSTLSKPQPETRSVESEGKL